MALAREFSLFYAPYVNSYKRYQASSFAPTSIVWSWDNRTCGFRIIGHGPSLRVECRIPGADANPYMAFAATVAAGLYGIENELELEREFNGDAYAAKELPRVPQNLTEAVAEFDSAVTDWELRRNFERI
jgi:glutamine synthetase